MLTVIVSFEMISLAQMLSFPAEFSPQVRNATDPPHLNRTQVSWYTSINSLTSVFGSLGAGIIMDRYGRRVALIVPLVPFIIAWIFTATAKSFYVLLISRAVLGICGGFGPPVCQIQMAECADSNLRSSAMNVGYVSLSIGFLVTFALGGIMNWRSLAWTGIILPILTLIGLAFVVPESPIWLIRHDQKSKALKNLIWLRGDINIARVELNQHSTRLNEEKANAQRLPASSLWRDFCQPYALKPIVIIFSFILLLNLSGTYLIVYYALDIISEANLVIGTKNANVILSTVRLIVTIVFCWLFMHVRRRRIYLIAGIGSTISSFALGLFLHVGKNALENRSILGGHWIVGLLFVIYVATNTGFMIAPGFLTGELLPARIRGRFAGYIYTFFSIVTFVLMKGFPLLFDQIGIVGALFIFGAASLLTTALVYFMIPETKGKSLLEIEHYFQQHGWIYRSQSSATS